MKIKKVNWLKTGPFFAALIVALFAAGFNLALAQWTAPTQEPPGGNVPPPINVGGATQTKSGDLNLQQNLNVGHVLTVGNVPSITSGSYGYINVAGICFGNQEEPKCRTSWDQIGGNQNLLQVLQTGANASSFSGLVRIGNPNINPTINTTPLDVGGALTVKWIHARSAGNNTIMGNLGIGTTDPGYKLTIAGGGGIFGVDNTATFAAKNSAGTYENYLWPRWSDNVMYLNYGSGGFNIRNVNSVSTMFMTNNGNVGMGTNNPLAKLHVSGALRTGYVVDSNIGDYSVGMGYNPIASGYSSTAMGHNSTASGNYSIAMGISSQATQHGTIALGALAKATNTFSIALGYNTAASGYMSTAMGRNTIASGQYSTAMGFNTIASGNYSTAMGHYNVDNNNHLFAVGKGSNDANRSNILTVTASRMGVGIADPGRPAGNTSRPYIPTVIVDTAPNSAYSVGGGQSEFYGFYNSQTNFGSGFRSNFYWSGESVGGVSGIGHRFTNQAYAGAISFGPQIDNPSEVRWHIGISKFVGQAGQGPFMTYGPNNAFRSIFSGDQRGRVFFGGDTDLQNNETLMSVHLETSNKSNIGGFYMNVSNPNSTGNTMGMQVDTRGGGNNQTLVGSQFKTIASNLNTRLYGIQIPVLSNAGNNNLNNVIGVWNHINPLGSWVGENATNMRVSGFVKGIENHIHGSNNGLSVTGHIYGEDTLIESGVQATGNIIGNRIQISSNNANNIYGVYSNVPSGNNRWAGYFTGNKTYVSELCIGNETNCRTNWTPASDVRLKKDITPITNALDKVLLLQGSNFVWRDSNERDIGLIAQEVEKVVPEVVTTNDEGYKYLDYGRLAPILIEAIKEQQKQIEALKAEIAELK